ncbi:hypothetical protein PSYAR_09313, partial [Pseudomonas syringae pv. aceris str. M302273]
MGEARPARSRLGQLGRNGLVALSLLQSLRTIERANHYVRPSISAAARYG